jgi:AcrR family transcriptional regulator
MRHARLVRVVHPNLPSFLEEIVILENSTLTGVEAPALRRGERRKQHTKRRLLDAAAETYAELGIEGATISSITERADVGLGTFYLHFEDKDTIAASVTHYVLNRIIIEEQTAIEAVRAVGGDPDPLAIFARVVCGRAADTPGLLCALLRWEGPRVGVLDDELFFASIRQALLPVLVERYEQGLARGLYRVEDSTAAANALLGALTTSITSWVGTHRGEWNALASFCERTMVAMFRL